MTDQVERARGPGRPPGTGTGSYPLNRKRSAFVRAVVGGMDPADAIIKAGYKTRTPQRMATRLMSMALVRAAIADAGSARVQLLEQLDTAKALAVKTNDASALVEALRLRCVLTGLLK